MSGSKGSVSKTRAHACTLARSHVQVGRWDGARAGSPEYRDECGSFGSRRCSSLRRGRSPGAPAIGHCPLRRQAAVTQARSAPCAPLITLPSLRLGGRRRNPAHLRTRRFGQGHKPPAVAARNSARSLHHGRLRRGSEDALPTPWVDQYCTRAFRVGRDWRCPRSFPASVWRWCACKRTFREEDMSGHRTSGLMRANGWNAP